MSSKSVLILGGTTEGRKAACVIDGAGSPFYYSTKEGELKVDMLHGDVLRGALTEDDMARVCSEGNVGLIIDAAHPFASNLHNTVSKVSDRLGIPVIRYERRYPAARHQEAVEWCESYDAIPSRLLSAGIKRVLVLTGVQSIAKLARPLKDMGIDAYFRILNRRSSLDKAYEGGVTDDRLLFYEDGGDDGDVYVAIRPDAIVVKESGESGGFSRKVDLAIEAGIRVFALHRPPIPDSFITVNGDYGLRLELEKLLPDFFPLHIGLTTGTCATAAAKGATLHALGYIAEGLHSLPITLPNGETISVEARICREYTYVTKYAGSDPDATDGLEIRAKVEIAPEEDKNITDASDCYPIVTITGGVGIGRVTLPGLGIEVGDAAINAVPRRMIEENIRDVADGNRKINVTLSVPDGERIAQRTFNPRLGITGGISIIGTSGIVQPFSSEAFLSSIRKSISVALATGTGTVVLNSGARSERAVMGVFPDIPSQCFVHYGNSIGDTLSMCNEMRVPDIVVGVMIGKAIKLAEGHLYTHSHSVTMNKSFIANILKMSGADEEIISKASDLNMARELLTLLNQEELQHFALTVLKHCHKVCEPIVPESKLTMLFIDDDLRVVATYS